METANTTAQLAGQLSNEALLHPAAGNLRRAAVACSLARAFVQPDGDAPAAIAEGLRHGLELDELRAAFAPALSAWERAVLTDVQDEYTRIFAGRLACPPYETAYGDGRRMAGRTWEMADIAGSYKAFGVQLSEAHRDRPDHVAAELEFLSVLFVKLAWAEADALDDAASVTLDALKDFLQRHIGRWLDLFAATIGQHSPGSPFHLSASAAADFVAAECRRLGVTPQKMRDGEPCGETEEDCVVCPMAQPQEGEAQSKCGTAPDLAMSDRRHNRDGAFTDKEYQAFFDPS